MTTTTFNALMARGLSPFGRTLAKGWASFTIEDALRLRLFVDLSSAGMPQAIASALVRDGFDGFLDFVNSHPQPAKAELLYGQIALSRVQQGTSRKITRPLYATVGRIDRALSDVLLKDQGSWSPSCVTLVNATECMERMLPHLGYAGDPEVRKWAEFMRASGASRVTE